MSFLGLTERDLKNLHHNQLPGQLQLKKKFQKQNIKELLIKMSMNMLVVILTVEVENG